MGIISYSHFMYTAIFLVTMQGEYFTGEWKKANVKLSTTPSGKSCRSQEQLS